MEWYSFGCKTYQPDSDLKWISHYSEVTNTCNVGQYDKSPAFAGFLYQNYWFKSIAIQIPHRVERELNPILAKEIFFLSLGIALLPLIKHIFWYTACMTTYRFIINNIILTLLTVWILIEINIYGYFFLLRALVRFLLYWLHTISSIHLFPLLSVSNLLSPFFLYPVPCPLIISS